MVGGGGVRPRVPFTSANAFRCTSYSDSSSYADSVVPIAYDQLHLRRFEAELKLFVSVVDPEI